MDKRDRKCAYLCQETTNFQASAGQEFHARDGDLGALKKMCSNGKEVYQILSAVQSTKRRSSGVCQSLIHPIPRPSRSVC